MIEIICVEPEVARTFARPLQPHPALKCLSAPAQILLGILDSLPTTASDSAPAAPGSLRTWLCATLQRIINGRPRAARQFSSSGGISILYRQLEAGPSDVSVQSCGVLLAALNQGGREADGHAAAEAAAEVRWSARCVA